MGLRAIGSRGFAIVLIAAAIGTTFSRSAEAAVASGAPVCTSNASAVPTSGGGAAYYLFESDGKVFSCGAAPLYGMKARLRKSNQVVAGAATIGGGGYWLATARGYVYPFGDAGAYGSPAHLHLPAPIVAFTPTNDNKGYWLVTAKGNLFHFGDAGFYGSTIRDHADGPVVSLVTTPDSKGYWIISADGVIHQFGDAPPLGSLKHRRPPVIAASPTPDGRGLILLTKNGGINNLGTSGFYGSLVHVHLPRPLTSIAEMPDGGGYIVAEATGRIYDFGDAPFEGSLTASPPRRPAAIVSISEVTLINATLTSTVVTSSSLLPHAAFGYDISNYQCSSPKSSTASSSLPPTSTFSVIEAAGWLDSANNTCLAAEAAWATAAAGTGGAHYSLYLFMNSPGTNPTAAALYANGPAGTCASLPPSSTYTQQSCIAYNYGYEGALAAVSYASSVGVSSPLWWLDVEGTNLSGSEWSNFNNGQYWSSNTSWNDDTIQGAIDALRSLNLTAGIYSTSVQFPTIAGTYVPTGAQVPLWIAGAPWTNPPYTETGLSAPSVLSGWCAGTSGYGTKYPSDLFAGGVPWLLQETPGSEPSPYGIDPNYAC